MMSYNIYILQNGDQSKTICKLLSYKKALQLKWLKITLSTSDVKIFVQILFYIFSYL